MCLEQLPHMGIELQLSKRLGCGPLGANADNAVETMLMGLIQPRMVSS